MLPFIGKKRLRIEVLKRNVLLLNWLFVSLITLISNIPISDEYYWLKMLYLQIKFLSSNISYMMAVIYVWVYISNDSSRLTKMINLFILTDVGMVLPYSNSIPNVLWLPICVSCLYLPAEVKSKYFDWAQIDLFFL